MPMTMGLPSHEAMSRRATRRIDFEVPGDVVPWARAGRSKTGATYTPARQGRYMATIKSLCAAELGGAPPLAGPIGLDVWANFATPISWSGKKRAAAYWQTSRPDWDNCAKIVCDALSGVAWLDDKQVCCTSVWKMYSAKPGLILSIWELVGGA